MKLANMSDRNFPSGSVLFFFFHRIIVSLMLQTIKIEVISKCDYALAIRDGNPESTFTVYSSLITESPRRLASTSQKVRSFVSG